MKAIVIVIVPVRETGTGSANPIPEAPQTAERELRAKTISTGQEPEQAFWTWFIDNPCKGRVAI